MPTQGVPFSEITEFHIDSINYCQLELGLRLMLIFNVTECFYYK